MLALFLHHMARVQQGVKYNALENCHAEGVHSIMLHDEPGNRVRVFYATRDHTLHRNTMGQQFSLAIHPHHCDVRLVKLFGRVVTNTYTMTPTGNGDFKQYKYTSGVAHKNKGKLTPTGERAYMHVVSEHSLGREGIMLNAWDMHSIYVGEGDQAAWMVIEGAEDSNYKPLCWTNAQDVTIPPTFYQPMEQQQVSNLLTAISNTLQD